MRPDRLKVWSPLGIFLLLSGFLFLIPILPAQAVETVQTDQPEYAVGDFATITGSGFAAGVTVTLEVQRVDNVVDRTDITVQPDGTFQYVYYLNPNLPNPDAAFRGTLTVRALINNTPVATTTFKDNPQWTLQGCSKAKGNCLEKTSGGDWAKEGDQMGGWTSGALQGWFEGENVPYRLRVSLSKSADGNKNYFALTEHDNSSGGTTGIDGMSGFYVGAGPSSIYPEGYDLAKNCVPRTRGTGVLIPTSTTPCYVSGPTYSGVSDDGDVAIDEDPVDGIDNDNDGRIDEDPPKNAAGPNTTIQYVWAVHFDANEAGSHKDRWAFYWKAHLAAGSSLYPGASLHADASPSGSQDVPIQNEKSCSTADLSVIKTDSPDPVSAGGTITYTIKVRNWGPDSASGVTMVDTLPSGVNGVVFVSASGSGWACSYNSAPHAVTCTRGNSLGDRDWAPDITMVVRAPSPSVQTTISNKAEVYWSGSEGGNLYGNVFYENTTVQAASLPKADLSITKVGPPDPGVQAGGTITYAITVTNNGPDAASGITVTDPLPTGTTFISAVGTGWSCGQAAGVVTCTLASLAVGSAPAIAVAVQTPTPNFPTTVTNKVKVETSGSDDTNVGNNTAVAETIVSGIAEVSIAKSAPYSVLVNGTLTYTLTVTNNGPSSASGVSVSDVLPAGVAFVSASGTGWTCGYTSGTVFCTRATLSVGVGPSIAIVVTAPGTPGSLGNTASVTAFELDTYTGNNSSTVTTTVSPAVDLSISKTGPALATAGSGMTYTIGVNNAGPSPATGVTVTDVLPTGMTYGSAAGTGWTCTQAGGTVTCTQSSLGVGPANNIAITVTAPSQGGSISNTVSISANETDTNTGNNVATAVTTVNASSDLSIVKTGPSSVTAGQNLTYALTVTNGGPSTASGVSITDTIPAGTTFVSANGTGWTCTGATTVTCTMASLAAGAANPISITVTAPASGSLSNTASVSSTSSDPNAANNASGAVSTSVTPSSDLSIAKTGPATATSGQSMTYTVTVTNNGPSTASSISVTDTLPAGATLVGAAGTGWTCTGTSTVTCTMASLAAGSANPITITATAPAAGGGISNTATVSATTGDPIPGNNSATVNTSVTASADLTVAKSGPASVTAGQNLTYTVTVTNNGPSTATNVTVTDSLPAGTTLVGASGTGWTCSGTTAVTCTMASLAAGTANPITITVTAPANGTISNAATVSSSIGDPNTANNTSATVNTTVTESSDLSIAKTGPATVTGGQNVTYTLTVSNVGPSAASSISVTDTIPAGTTFVSASGTGWTCSGTATVTCTLVSLAVGSANPISITVTSPFASGTISNTASVSAATGDPNAANNTSAAVNTTINPASADLAIAKSGPASVTAGQNLTYTLSVVNYGPSTTQNVTVTDNLPAGTTFVSAAGTNWTCTQSTGVVTCTLAGLAVTTANPISITVTAPSAGGGINNSANVSSTITTDPVASNNSSTVGTIVYVSADLSISKTGPASVTAGQNLTYTITVSNAGPSSASSVTVTDTIPAGTTFVSASGSPGAWSCIGSTTVTCTLASLSSGSTQTISITVTAPAEPTTLGNTASVSSTTGDPNTANNTSATVNTAVTASSNLSIAKTGPASASTGQSVAYILTVSNAGPSTATGITVTDTIPAGTTYVSASGMGWTCTQSLGTVTCTLSSLAVGSANPVTITVTAPATAGTISNTGTVFSTTADPNTANNTSAAVNTTISATTVQTSDLSIVMSGPATATVGQNLMYTITVTNNGPNAASGVTVTENLPTGVTFVSATPTQGTCSQAAGVVTCNILGGIASGASVTITVDATAPTTAGSITNTSNVTTTTNDPNAANNSANQVTTVSSAPVPTADLSITNVDTPDPVGVGLSITHTITVANNGPNPATGVVVTDTLGASTTLVSITPMGGCTGISTLTCGVGNLASGASTVITVTVATSVAEMVGNTASVTGNEADSNLTNNSVTATTNVGDLSRLTAISTRSLVKTGSEVEITGFIVGGNLPKTLLVRGRGPSLGSAPFNIGGTLLDPFLQIYSGQTLIAQNDNWQTQTDLTCANNGYTCGTAAQITATTMDPCIPNPGQTAQPANCSNESALLITLPPGAYTAILSGVGGATGVGIAEVYDTDGSTLPKMVAISTRATVMTGNNVEIGGFIVGAGTGNKTVLIRARGPSMGSAPYNIQGVLANPTVELYSGQTKIAQNDDWQTTDPLCGAPAVFCGGVPEITAARVNGQPFDPCQPNSGQTTAPTNCNLESMLYVTLPPGPYTAIVRGLNGGTGVGLVEVYELGQ